MQTDGVNSGPLGRLLSFLARLLGIHKGRSAGPATAVTQRGTVAFWHSEEGWGAVQTPERQGVGFAHFSHIRGVQGYRELNVGEPVEFEWTDDFQQDGCQYRVTWVRPVSR
jgi:cold shock CspA family protein